MAEIKINIPDQFVGRVLDAYSTWYGYESNKKEGESKAAFAKRMIVTDQIKGFVQRHEMTLSSNLRNKEISDEINAVDIN